MMTCILSQVSESFKNSLRRSPAGTANDATETREQTRRSTANTATNTRETVTFKAAGFKLDTKYERVRLSKGSNLKEYWSDFILCEYQTRPDVDLSTVESVQQVRAVWTGDEWELHFVCKVNIEVAESPGEKTVGVDLGVCNFAALAFENQESELYPLNCLKQDDYYYSKHIARCDDSASAGVQAHANKTLGAPPHALKHIVQRCIDEEVGTIVVGDLSGIREDEENGESKNWGKHGNLDLHSWAFDRFTSMLKYKAEMEGISVEQVSERDTSKSCSCCGRSETRTALNVGCTCVMSVNWWRTRT